MRQHQLLDRAQFSRAAIHLIQSHGSRATAVAMKRAVFLHQCGEDAGAETWRKIAACVNALEADGERSAGMPHDNSGEPSERRTLTDQSEAERSLALTA